MSKFTESEEYQEQMRKQYPNGLSGADYQSYFEKTQAMDNKQLDIQNALNVLRSYSKDEMTVECFLHCLIQEHRTHQQSIIRNLFNILKKYGELNYCDARNQEAVDWAKNATKGEQYFPYL